MAAEGKPSASEAPRGSCGRWSWSHRLLFFTGDHDRHCYPDLLPTWWHTPTDRVRRWCQDEVSKSLSCLRSFYGEPASSGRVCSHIQWGSQLRIVDISPYCKWCWWFHPLGAHFLSSLSRWSLRLPYNVADWPAPEIEPFSPCLQALVWTILNCYFS